VDFGAPLTINLARLEEDIARGQRVARYTIFGTQDGEWDVLSQGTTIGYAKLDRFAPKTVRRVRLIVQDAVATPKQVALKLYNAPT
jgi:alpha-L-fucosidase